MFLSGSGGAAVTCKHEVEKINEEDLGRVSSHLRQAMMGSGSVTEVLGMDWSRGAGAAGIDSISDLNEYAIPNLDNLIIVHGAGCQDLFPPLEHCNSLILYYHMTCSERVYEHGLKQLLLLLSHIRVSLLFRITRLIFSVKTWTDSKFIRILPSVLQ